MWGGGGGDRDRDREKERQSLPNIKVGLFSI